MNKKTPKEPLGFTIRLIPHTLRNEFDANAFIINVSDPGTASFEDITKQIDACQNAAVLMYPALKNDTFEIEVSGNLPPSIKLNNFLKGLGL